MRCPSGPQARAACAGESARSAQRTREFSKRFRRPSLRLKTDVAHELAVLGVIAADDLAEVLRRFGDDDQPGGHELVAHVGQLHCAVDLFVQRSEEHTSELQSRLHLVCRLLLEKKKKK